MSIKAQLFVSGKEYCYAPNKKVVCDIYGNIESVPYDSGARI